MTQIKAPQPAPAEGQVEEVFVSLYQSSKKIHPRTVSGVFSNWRWGVVVLTQLVFYGLPWIDWGARQAVLFDLVSRRFYLGGIVFYPQDFIYLTGLLVVSALSLFLFTAVAGRLWCGYACPQTVYTEIFLWIERTMEGDRQARLRLDAAPWNWNKLRRRGSKQLLWVAVALWTGFTFVGYFTPIRQLWGSVLSLSTGPWESFWILFYSFATYGNAGFMREQVCKYMCPYARFQSAMFDKDTLIVSYDEGRGEPRGARKKSADIKLLGLGECVDCSLCVQVCPTGIDIRKGLQYECIGCGACADVCDTVMEKVGYPKGLVRYSTQNAVKSGWTRNQMWRRVLRPRVLVYTGILGALVVALGISLALRVPFRVDVVRDRATLARVVEGGRIENVYRLQVMNATEQAQVFQVSAHGVNGLSVDSSDADLNVGPAESRWVVLRLRAPNGAAAPGSHPIHFEIDAKGLATRITEKSVFIVPR